MTLKKNKKTFFNENITRRDILGGACLGVGTALLASVSPAIARQSDMYAPRPSKEPDWYGYGGVGDYRHSHGNTPDVVANAHRLRDGEFPQSFDKLEAVEDYDYVIVGCGIAGLSAGLEYVKSRTDGQSCLMLDNHPIFGGEAKENEFLVNGTKLLGPQGANGFFIPPKPDCVSDAKGDPRVYAELGLPREYQLAAWPADKKPLGFSPDNYEYLVKGLQEQTSVGHFYKNDRAPLGKWATDMWANKLKDTAMSLESRERLLRWYHTGSTRQYSSEAEAIAALDTMSYKDFLEKELGLGSEGSDYANLFLASAGGLGSDATSAYAAYKLPMSGFMDMPPADSRRNSFPGGNSGFARHFLKRIIPDGIKGGDSFEDIITGGINFDALDRPGKPIRMRLNATVLSVKHDHTPEESESVQLVYVKNGKFYGIRAKGVVMATGSWINRRVVRDMPETVLDANRKFKYAPFLVANIALTNWRFLYKMGITAAIWNRDEDGFGYTCNIRNPMHIGDYKPPLDPNQPTVLSFYTPFIYPGHSAEEQVMMGRGELLGTSYSDYEGAIYSQMMTLFGSAGFNPKKDVAGLILNRWGHAFSVPYPGFYGGKTGVAPRDIIRKGYGRIAFGHSELDGLQHYGPAAEEGRRAFYQVKR